MTTVEAHQWRAWRERRDAQAFEALVRPHLRFLQDFVRRLGLCAADADDVVQSALVDLAFDRSDRPRRVGLRAWLGRSARSHALGFFRAARRRARREARAASVPAGAPAPSLEIEDQVQAALAQLDEKAREAVVLRYLHDLDYKEIAHILRTSETGCRVRVHRAIARLRRSLGKSAPAAVAALPLLAGRADARAALAGASFPSAIPVGGVLLMSLKAKTVLVLLAVATVGFVGWKAARERAAPPARAERAVARDLAPPAAKQTVPAKAAGEEHGTAPRARDARPERPPADAPVAPDKGSVRGTVRFLDGSPAAGLRVGLWGASEVEDVTDAEGRFHLHNDWVGLRSLFVKGPHDYMFILSKPFDMKAGERIEVVVDLDRGVDVAGRVIAAATEEPIEGAQVTLRRQPGQFGQGSAGFVKTDADGRFAFHHVPRTRYSLDVVAKAFTAADLRFDLQREPAPDVVRLMASRSLVVRIENAPEAAVGSKVSWMLQARDGALMPSGKALFSKEGELRIDAPPSGKYNLILFSGEHLPRFERNVEIGDGPTEPIVFRMRAGAVVVGTLRDTKGKPVPEAVLRASSAKARTDADGRFRFERVPGGRRSFRLGVPNGSVALADVDVPSEGEKEVDLALPGPGAIVGDVDPNARISLHAGDKPTNSALLQVKDPHKLARLSSGGRFRIPYLAPGTYVLVVRVLHGDRLVRRVTVAEGETVDLGDLGLRVYPAVPVRVSVPAGARLPGYVRVTYRIPARDGLDEELWGGGAPLDEQGCGSFHGPAPGAQEIIFQAKGFRSRTITIPVVEGMAPVVVELEPER